MAQASDPAFLDASPGKCCGRINQEAIRLVIDWRDPHGPLMRKALQGRDCGSNIDRRVFALPSWSEVQSFLMSPSPGGQLLFQVRIDLMAGKYLVALLCASLSVFFVAGCESKPQPKDDGKAASAGDAHSHEHGHGEHGPHGGHLLHLDPDGVHAEWTHDDDSKLITLYLDDLAKPAAEVKFVVKAGDAEPQTYALAKAEGSTGGGTWTIKDDALLTHLNMGEAANVKLVVVADGKELSTKIEHSDEHHHH